MNRYWPTTHPITFGILQVEMLEEEKKEFLEIRIFNVTNTQVSIGNRWFCFVCYLDQHY
jgi:uncharacterized ferritin-like protein (DUF455 family)